jgi:hypothetical protein
MLRVNTCSRYGCVGSAVSPPLPSVFITYFQTKFVLGADNVAHAQTLCHRFSSNVEGSSCEAMYLV